MENEPVECNGCDEKQHVIDGFQILLISYMTRHGISEIRVSPRDVMESNPETAVRFDLYPDRRTGELVCTLSVRKCPECSDRGKMN